MSNHVPEVLDSEAFRRSLSLLGDVSTEGPRPSQDPPLPRRHIV